MLSNIFNFYYFLGKTTVRTCQIFQWMTSQSNNKVFQSTIKHFQSSWKSIVLTFNCFVLFLARSGDFTIFHTCWDFRVDHMKNLFNHNREMINFLTCGKSIHIQSENSCQNESVSFQWDHIFVVGASSIFIHRSF